MDLLANCFTFLSFKTSLKRETNCKKINLFCIQNNMRRAKVLSHDNDEALSSPFSRISLCPETDQIINCAMGLRDPIEVDALKKVFSNSAMTKHPRFCSLVVRSHAGEYWRKTHVNIDDHFIIHSYHCPATATNSPHIEDEVEAAVNAFLADISVSTPLSENKPLWEVHVLLGLNCVVLRVHHALGDGASLMSMLSACFGKQMDGAKENENSCTRRKANGEMERSKGGVWGWVKCIWFTLVSMMNHLGRSLWVKDEASVIYGGEGVELWPRKLETVKFELQDFKSIKEVIPNATINDVLLGVISSGLSKYIRVKSTNGSPHNPQITAAIPVNLRKDPGLQELPDMMKSNTWWWGSSSWGNKVGFVAQPMKCCNGLHPLEHVKRMKAIMDQKKQSYEAHVFYIFMQLIVSCLGSKVASKFAYKLACSTTLTISNIMGPSEEMTIADNPITYLRVNISALPHALIMHMVSYAGKADMQVLVAKDVIPDSRFLVKCFQESLLEMKSYISAGNK